MHTNSMTWYCACRPGYICGANCDKNPQAPKLCVASDKPSQAPTPRPTLSPTARPTGSPTQPPPTQLAYSGGRNHIFVVGSEVLLTAAVIEGGNATSWSVTHGELPAGLAMSVSTGTISGAPRHDVKIGSVIVTATNSGGSASIAVAYVILPAPTVIPAPTSPLAPSVRLLTDAEPTAAEQSGTTLEPSASEGEDSGGNDKPAVWLIISIVLAIVIVFLGLVIVAVMLARRRAEEQIRPGVAVGTSFVQNSSRGGGSLSSHFITDQSNPLYIHHGKSTEATYDTAAATADTYGVRGALTNATYLTNDSSAPSSPSWSVIGVAPATAQDPPPTSGKTSPVRSEPSISERRGAPARPLTIVAQAHGSAQPSPLLTPTDFVESPQPVANPHDEAARRHNSDV